MNIPILSSQRLTGDQPVSNALQSSDAEIAFAFAPLLDEHFPSEDIADDKSRALPHETPPTSSSLIPVHELTQQLPLDVLSTNEGRDLSLLTRAHERLPQLPERPFTGENSVERHEPTLTPEEAQTPRQPDDNSDATLLHGLFALLPASLAVSQYKEGTSPQKEPALLTKEAALLPASLVTASLTTAAETTASLATAPLTTAPFTTTAEPSLKVMMRSSLPPDVITEQPTVPSIKTSSTHNTDTPLPALTSLTEPNQHLSSSPLPTASPWVSTPSTTLVNVPTAPLLSAQLGSAEWQHALSQQIIMFRGQGQQHSELRLHPQELGTLHITLKLDDNQAQLHIASAQGAVRSAVEAALPHLRQALAEQGINLGQSSVGSDPSPSSQHTFQHSHSPSYREQHSPIDDDIETASPSIILQTPHLLTEGIDTFA